MIIFILQHNSLDKVLFWGGLQ